MKKRYILLLIFLVFAAYVLKTCHDAGSFKSLAAHSPGEVVEIYTSMPGTEDMDVVDELGLLFISSSERRGRDAQKDGIYLLDLNEKQASPKKLAGNFGGDFHPHGLSLLYQDSTVYLHVVNHNDQGDFIEIFEYKDEYLNHLLSLSTPEMCCPNDVVAVDKFKCYITNDHGSSGKLSQTFENFLKIPRAYILYFDGSQFSRVYEGLNYANGINISTDANLLYVTHTTGQEMLTFKINNSDGSLEKLSTIDLHTGVDNIDVDPDGEIWIGCHPRLFDFMGHAKDSLSYSPSQVLRLTPEADNPVSYKVTEVFLDDGSLLSGSSVAVRYGGELFVGVVFDHKLLRIKL